MTIAEQKAEWRQKCRRIRLAIPQSERLEADAIMLHLLRESTWYKEAHALLLYAPIGSEIGLTALVPHALAEGKRLYFPRCEKDGYMTFYRIEVLSNLIPGAYGISEPSGGEAFDNDPTALCVLPGLAFDKQGYRIGYGGGYYDRFLTTFAGIALGLVYDRLLFPSLPRDTFDRPARVLISEKGVIMPPCTNTSDV